MFLRRDVLKGNTNKTRQRSLQCFISDRKGTLSIFKIKLLQERTEFCFQNKETFRHSQETTINIYIKILKKKDQLFCFCLFSFVTFFLF